MQITFTIAHNISHSKGWGRYKAITPSGRLVKSSTGNEWVSASHAGEAEEGTPITATLQTMQRVGKLKKESINATDYNLIAAEGRRAEIGYWNTLQVVVENARVVA
jgi:hypothetical protein